MAAIADRRRTFRRGAALGFEKAKPGAIYHAVDEEGVSMKAIAEALGRLLKVPVASIKPFGRRFDLSAVASGYRYSGGLNSVTPTALHRIANGCFPVQSGIELTSKSVLVGIRSNKNFRLKPTLCV